MAHIFSEVGSDILSGSIALVASSDEFDLAGIDERDACPPLTPRLNVALVSLVPIIHEPVPIKSLFALRILLSRLRSVILRWCFLLREAKTGQEEELVAVSLDEE